LTKRTIRPILEIIFILTLVTLSAYRDSFWPQRVIDGGLLYSGLIDYQTDSYMFKVLTESLTILHPFSGFLLGLGISILKVSFTIQFIHLLILASSTFYILKALNFNGIYALSLVTVLTFSLPDITQIFIRNYGTLINSVHTYGQFGLSLSIAAVCLIINKKYFSLGLFFPIFFATHVGWAAFMFSILCIALVMITSARINFKFKHFIYGFTLSSILLVPLIIFNLFRYKSSFINTPFQDLKNQYRVYIDNWDYHRSFDFAYSVLTPNLFLFTLILIFVFKFKKISLEAKTLLIIALLGIAISTSLYILNDKILSNSNVSLSALMPSRFFNFQAYLSLIIISLMVKVIYSDYRKYFRIRHNYIGSLNLISFLSIFLTFVYFQIPSIGTRTDFDFRPVSFFESTNFSKVCDNLKVSNGENLILTNGSISRLVPLFCRQPILIDTTQIDFLPYIPETIPYLAKIMEEVYGIPFEGSQKLEKLYRSDLNPWFDGIPSGTIEPVYQQPLWSLRTKERWDFLACQYDFNKIVTYSDLKLKIANSVQVDDFNIYSVNPENCLSDSSLNFIDTYSSTVVEFTDKREPFIWLYDYPTTLNIRSFSKKIETVNLTFKFGKNPCNLNQNLNLDFNGKKQEIVVGSKNTSIQIPVSLKSNNYTEVVLTTFNSSQVCKVGEDKRNLVTKIESIDFQEFKTS
jgi:hypothetical protein